MPTDYPRADIATRAAAAIAANGGPSIAEVYFKFTCATCGMRCQFNEPNRLYETGECGNCGSITTVTQAGFALLLSTTGQPLHVAAKVPDEDQSSTRRGTPEMSTDRATAGAEKGQS